LSLKEDSELILEIGR